jgi:deazaflavin-dependent oxidoreductase (nitroreductase family)
MTDFAVRPSSEAGAPVSALDPLAGVPRHLHRMFTPRTGPPSALGRAVNRAFVRSNVALFRASSGRLGGRLGGMDVLLLSTLGRRTGATRTSALLYVWDQGRFVVCAAYGGHIVHPAWYLNLLAVPRGTVELGVETLRVRAETLPAGPERDRLWQLLVAGAGNFARFQAMTTRVLPVVVLTPMDYRPGRNR